MDAPQNFSIHHIGHTLYYGGSFNPIHNGHLVCVVEAANILKKSRVVLIPCADPPHKKANDLLDFRSRMEMCAAAVGKNNFRPYISVTDCEHRRAMNGFKSYTYTTVMAIKEAHQFHGKLDFLVGGDSVPQLKTWYRIEELLQEANIYVAGRPGYPIDWEAEPDYIKPLRDKVLPLPLISISATHIRSNVASGNSIRYMVPDAVDTLIQARGYYSLPST